MKLENKIALVTGSSSGIGRGIAVAFAKEGADVIVNYNSRKDEAEEVVKKIRDMGRKSIAVKANTGSIKEIEEMFKVIKDEFDGLDILINNAGISEYHVMDEMNEEIWERTLSINLKGPFFCCKFAYKEMEKRGGGKIVNIASCGGIRGFRNLPHYCASKGGLIALTKQLAGEFGEFRINVNCIGPGAIVTERSEDYWSSEGTRKVWEKVIPLGRIGLVDEIIGGVVYLSSSDSDYVTGQTFFIDGGWTSQANWPGANLL